MTRLLWVAAALFLLVGVGAFVVVAGHGAKLAGGLIGLVVAGGAFGVALLVARFSGRRWKGPVEP